MAYTPRDCSSFHGRNKKHCFTPLKGCYSNQVMPTLKMFLWDYLTSLRSSNYLQVQFLVERGWQCDIVNWRLDQESIGLAFRLEALLTWGDHCSQFSSGLGGSQNLPRASHKPEVSRNKAETRIEHLQDRAAAFKGSAGIGEGLGISGTGLDHHQGVGRAVGCLESRQVRRTGHHWHGDYVTAIVQEVEQAGSRSEGTVPSENFDTISIKFASTHL